MRSASLLVGLTALLIAAPALATTVYLTSSNVSEFDGKVSIPVQVDLVDGNTRITIPALTTWPVQNTFLGLDKLYYNAVAVDHPVIRVIDGACDEMVVAGEACGWSVNFDGTQADGFGSFASRTNADPAGTAATTASLVFYLQGDADILPNSNGAMFAVHGRFGGTSCSGYFSDGEAASVTSAPGCIPTEGPQCELGAYPQEVNVYIGGSVTISISVAASGLVADEQIMLSLRPSPLPPYLNAVFMPNPVAPGEQSVLTLTALPGLEPGIYDFVITGNGTVSNDPTCYASIKLIVRKLSGCACEDLLPQ